MNPLELQIMDTLSQPPSDGELIDRIEAIRAVNNRRWMDLVRLAVELAPDRAKAILREIAQHDGDVRRLTQELAR